MWTRSALLAALAAAAAVLMSAGVSAAEIKGSAYADLRYGIDHYESSGAGATGTITSFANHGSYWGVKGSTSKDGMTAFGAYERWLDGDNTGGAYDVARESYAGLATQWGTVQFGTFATAYMEAGRKLDPFYATGASLINNPTQLYSLGGQSHGQSLLTADTAITSNGFGGFVANQLAYTSPTLFGFTGNVAVMFDDNTPTNQARQDDYAAGLEWSSWGLMAGAQYLDANSNSGNTGLAKGESATRLYGGYAQDRFGGNVSAERIDGQNGLPDAQYLQVNGWFGVLPSTRVAASYGMENETGAEGTSVRVGVFYDVIENFTLNAVYRNYNAKNEQNPFVVVGNPDDQVISLGASYRFEIGASTTTH